MAAKALAGVTHATSAARLDTLGATAQFESPMVAESVLSSGWVVAMTGAVDAIRTVPATTGAAAEAQAEALHEVDVGAVVTTTLTLTAMTATTDAEGAKSPDAGGETILITLTTTTIVGGRDRRGAVGTTTMAATMRTVAEVAVAETM